MNTNFKAAILEQKRDSMGNFTRPNIQRQGLGYLRAIDNTIDSIETLARAGTDETLIHNSHSDWSNSSATSGATWTTTESGLQYQQTGGLDLQVQDFIAETWAAAANVTYTISQANGDITLSVTGPARASTFMDGSGGDMLNNETMTIASKVYTFQTNLTNTDGNVLIGADANASLNNLKAAINGDSGSGTLYAADTTTHTLAVATTHDIAAETLVVQAIIASTAGNAYNLLEGTTNWIVDNATFENGAGVYALGTLTLTDVMNADDTVTIGHLTYTLVAALSSSPTVAYEIVIGGTSTATSDNLMNAINGGTGSGVTYGVGTLAHPLGSATSPTNTVIFSSYNTSSASNAIITLESGSEASWGAGTLASGAGTDNRYDGRIIIK